MQLPKLSKLSNLNIRTRMLLLCLGVAAPLLAIGSFALWKEYRTLRHEAERATTFQAAITSRTLQQWTEAQLKTLGALASLPDIQSTNLESTQKILTTTLAAQPDWSEINLVTTKGVPLVSTTPPAKRAVLFSSCNFFTSVADGKKPAISDYIRSSPLSGKPALLASTPIIHDGKVTAVLVAAIKPRAVHNLFDGLGGTSETVVAVVDKNKRVITRTLQNEYWEGKDFSHAKTVQASTKKLRGTIEGVGIADPTPRAYAFDRVPSTGWLVVVGVPTDSIYGAAHDWLVIMVVLAVCAISVSVGLACLVTDHFTKTIHVLVKEAIAIGKGDFSKRVKVPARDELGLLARAFNEMAMMLESDKEHKTMVQGISESIRQCLDLEDILNTAVRELGQNLEASRCCLALLDTKDTADVADDELMFNYVWWNEQLGGAPLKNRSILVTEHSELRHILQQGTVLSMDIRDEQGPTPLFENSKGSPDDWRSIRSLIACPISTREGPLGMILVHQCDSLRQWTDAELELVAAVAGQVTLAMEHSRLYNYTKKLADQEVLINHIVRSVRSSLDLDTTLATVTGELLAALGADRIQIAQPRAEGPLVITHETHTEFYQSIQGMSMYPDNMDFHPNMSFNSQVPGRNTVLGINLDRLTELNSDPTNPEGIDTTLRDAPIAIINNVFADSRAMPFKDFLDHAASQSLIAAPLLNENRLVGLLIVHQCRQLRNWRPDDIRLVAAIADQVAVAITHAHLFAQVRHQAITDGLTGLYNHIYFKNRLSEEIRLSERKNTPLALIMIDLDKLKQINDNFGHPVGDAAIRQVAAILKTLLRSGDTAARYGGEEFGIILPDTSLLEAALIADRLCSQIRNSHVPGLGRITASLGTAAYPKQAHDMADLIDKADKALYVAKNSGRDQVRIYEEEQAVIEWPSLSEIIDRDLPSQIKKISQDVLIDQIREQARDQVRRDHIE